MAHLGTYGAVWMGATWSLAIEEQFYALFPFVVRHANRRLVRILIGGIAGATLLRIGCYWYFRGDDFASYVWMPCRLDSLCMGGLLACTLRMPAARLWLSRSRHMVVGIFGLSAVGAVVLAGALPRNIGYHMSLWGHSLLAVVYTLAILLVILYGGRSVTAFFRLRLLTGLGRISYGVYLIHGIALAGISSLAGMPVSLTSFEDAGLACVALLLTVTICSLSYRWFELPILAIGRKASYS